MTLTVWAYVGLWCHCMGEKGSRVMRKRFLRFRGTLALPSFFLKNTSKEDELGRKLGPICIWSWLLSSSHCFGCQQFANWGEVTNYAAAINGLDSLGTHELTTSLGRAISLFGVWSLTMNLQAKVLEPVSLWLVLRSFKSGWVRSPDGSTASVIIKCLKFGSSSFMFFSANHSLKDNMNCFFGSSGSLV